VQADEPLHHAELVRGLCRAAAAGRLPHALLFTGPSGIGKFRAALWFARGLLCARGIPTGAGGPCGTCGPCVRALADTHPDLFRLEAGPDEERLKLERFVAGDSDERTAEDFVRLKSAEGGWRVLVVREMERAVHSQNEAQNSILKMLEEPGEGFLWILETSRPSALLPTIRSRCVTVRFEGLGEEEVTSVLAGHGLEGEEARRLARWSRGSPGAALALRRRGAADLREAVQAALSGAPPLAAARSAWEVEAEYTGRTQRMQDRERARTLLDLACAVVADQLRSACGVDPAGLAHGDLAPLAGRSAGARVGLERALDALLTSRSDIERNLDPAAVVDRAFCALGEVR